MASLRYDGRFYNIDDAALPTYRAQILDILNGGRSDWLEVQFEDDDGNDSSTWFLISPGAPIILDEDDMPEMPPMPDLPALLGRPGGGSPR